MRYPVRHGVITDLSTSRSLDCWDGCLRLFVREYLTSGAAGIVKNNVLNKFTEFLFTMICNHWSDMEKVWEYIRDISLPVRRIQSRHNYNQPNRFVSLSGDIRNSDVYSQRVI